MENAAEMYGETASADYFSPLSREEVAGVAQPVLLLGGGTSPAIFAPLLDELGRLLPRSTRLTIPASSHNLHIQNPRAYNEAVLGFLGAN
jgi:pimeloyl-ACP methyl ester carboxylesterase